MKDLERDKLKVIHLIMQHMMCKKKRLDITYTVIIILEYISNISSQLFLIRHFSAEKKFKSRIIKSHSDWYALMNNTEVI